MTYHGGGIHFDGLVSKLTCLFMTRQGKVPTRRSSKGPASSQPAAADDYSAPMHPRSQV